LFLGDGPPLKIEMEILQNWSVCVFTSLKNKKIVFARRPQGRWLRAMGGDLAPHLGWGRKKLSDQIFVFLPVSI